MNINNNKIRLLKTGEEIFGARGFTNVGLSEILQKAGIPKGSFYYYFQSKEDFGVQAIEYYLHHYTEALQQLFDTPTLSGKERLLAYWQKWIDTQSINNCEGRCLIVRLSSEVADYSDSMRQALCNGTRQILNLMANVIQVGQHDGSIPKHIDAVLTAKLLYQQWLGASLVVKIEKKTDAFTLAGQYTHFLLAK